MIEQHGQFDAVPCSMAIAMDTLDLPAQIRRVAEAHGITRDAAQMLVASGLNERQVASVAAVIKTYPVDLFSLLGAITAPIRRTK